MVVCLTLNDLAALRAAISIATLSEEDFIECHTNKYTRKSIDEKVTTKSRKIIRRWAALDKKIAAKMKAVR